MTRGEFGGGFGGGLRAAALALGALAASVSATAFAAPRSDLVLGMSVEPSTLDPTAAAPVVIGQVVWQNLFEGLTRIDREGAVQPQLARAWTISEDGLTYEFKLATGVKFHNGADFTAETAKFSLERITAAGSTNPQKALFAPIASVEAADAETLILHLSEPSSNLLFWLGNPAGVMVEPGSAETNAVEPVGTGPFTFGSWRRGDRVELLRNAEYWDAENPVHLERAEFRFIPDAQAQAAALRAHDVDAFPLLSAPELYASFQADPAFTAEPGVTGYKVVAGMNLRAKPLSDPRVRQALMHAVDREILIEGAASGYGAPIGSHFSPTDAAYVDETGVYPYDPAKSRALLAEAGYPDGFSLTIKSPQMAYATRSSEILQAFFADVGVGLTIAPTEFPAKWVAEVMRAHEFEMTIVAHAEPLDIGIYANPEYYFGYDGAEFREVVGAAARATAPEERLKLYGEAQAILAKDVPALFLYVQPKLSVWDAKLTGLWRDEPIPSNDLTEVRWTE